MAIGENFDAQKLLQRLDRLPAPARGGVLAAIALLVVGIYFMLFFGSNQTALRAMQTRRAKVEQDIQAARAVANNLESFKRKREELGAQLQAALEKLPESSDLPALLTNISTLARSRASRSRPSGRARRSTAASTRSSRSSSSSPAGITTSRCSSTGS